MKTKLTILTSAVLLAVFIFLACNKEARKDSTNLNYYSKSDIAIVKKWLLSNDPSKNEPLGEMPNLSYYPKKIDADTPLMFAYLNKVMFHNDKIIEGTESNYDKLILEVKQCKALGTNSKEIILSSIQMNQEIISDIDIKNHIIKANKGLVMRGDVCGCDQIYKTYQLYYYYCSAYRNLFGPAYCNNAAYYWNLYLECKSMKPTCPNGFIFDGANCYSGLHFPKGYEGFIWGQGFYTKPNCNISRNNNCCPSGYIYDGANCHFYGLYFPKGWEPFMWNNAFYLKPKCK